MDTPSDERDGADQRTPLIEPPTLRTEDDRAATRLELFFDLAYVLVVHQLALALTADVTGRGVATFVGLFAVTWWSWVTSTLYANRFDTNDVLYRLLKLAATFAVAVMAAAAATAVGGDGTVAFGVGYIATRVILAALYLRARRHIPDVRVTVDLYLAATTVSIALWAVSLFTPSPITYVLWAAGIAVEAAAPFAATRWGPDVPLHLDHLPERFGLFVILVLGESISAIVLGTKDTHWALPSIAVSALGFTIAAAVWWMYFDIGGAEAKTEIQDDERAVGSGRADGYIYGHLPLTLGVALLGVGIEQYVLHPVGELTDIGRWLLSGGVALFVVGVCLVLAWSSGGWRMVVPWPALAVPVVLLVGLVDTALPFASAIVLAVGAVVTVITGVVRRRRSPVVTTET
ncbi:low temperature requirement protein A [Rhodococcoides corynebacterioides]|uniref:Low temperature requirement protein A n=1 Tax=Rhodococcoides corynebacterioides TaxID=53972 RepID=A0ABS7P7K7_9NOCA|nr:low temperature requirement protein A [Rhodococcus corynebacterioides]MBY6368400.1 low temperature requirement protein A [Rhodococcus corynebacterioides]MBY6409833.1 low temperature requirement protein A [Rhodococcus corynebacterioides]